MKDEIEDWIRFHCIEEDQTVRRRRTRDTRKAAGVPLGRKEVDELFQERETMYESLAFLSNAEILRLWNSLEKES